MDRAEPASQPPAPAVRAAPAASAAIPGDGPAIAPLFSVLRRSTLPEEIANRLLGLIRAQELRPGDKLPSERTLAATMEVSRPVLREALRALAIMRVVDIRQGAGTYITALEPQQLVSHLDLVFSKDTIALEQLLEARRVVEVGNARLAAGRIGPERLAELEATVGALEASVGDAGRFGELDMAFHDIVGAAASNFVLGQFMVVIDTLGRVSRERTGASREVREVMLRDHRRIVEALRTRDPAAAADAMAEHLDHVEGALAAETGPAAESRAESRRRSARNGEPGGRPG